MYVDPSDMTLATDFGIANGLLIWTGLAFFAVALAGWWLWRK